LHWSFEDPLRAEGEGEERLAVFRRVRDEIRTRVEIRALIEGELVNEEVKT
jgi:arsenate reductase